MKFAVTKKENTYPATLNEAIRLSVAHTFMDGSSLQILAGLVLSLDSQVFYFFSTDYTFKM